MRRLPLPPRRSTSFRLEPVVVQDVFVGYQNGIAGKLFDEKFPVGAGALARCIRARVTWSTDNYACELQFENNEQPWGATYLAWELANTPTVSVAWQSSLGLYRCWPNPWFWAGMSWPISSGCLSAWMRIRPSLVGFTDTGTPFPST